MRRMILRFSVVTGAFALAGAAIAAPAWLDIAREMAKDGESVHPGVAGDAGWYVAAISEVVKVDGGSEAEAMQRARLVGKRLIAGFVAGEKVGASEESSLSEVTVGDKTETSDAFRQRITVDVDAVLRGAEVVGTVEGDGGRKYLVVATSSDMADASAALAAKMKGLGPDTVLASGFAPISEGGLATAREAALAAAKSSAVEMVLGAAVASTEAAVNLNAGMRLFSNAGGFIEEFRVTDEGDQDGSYKVTIAAKVARGKLMDDYGAALASFGNVKFHVLDIGQPELTAMLAEKRDEWRIPRTADRETADYLVWSRWKFDDEVNPMDGRAGTRLTLTLAVRDAATGREYFSANNDPRKAVSFIGDRTRRIRHAANAAMKEIHERVHERFDTMIGTMAVAGRDVRLLFDNYSEAYAGAFEAIRQAVEATPGCKNTTTRIDAARREAEIGFRCQMDMDSLRKLLEPSIANAVPGAALRPDSVFVDANTWKLAW